MRVNGASMHGRHFASAARGVTERRIPLFSPRWLRGYVLGTMLLMLGSVPAMEAQVSASITGIVTDASGAPVPAATVTAKNLETGAARSSVTVNAGRYQIVSLAVGQYEET